MAKNSREDFLKIEGVQEKLELIAKNNEFTIDELLSVIEKESSFDHTAKNKNSSATGLIQFMADTAKGLGTTTKALGSMTVLDQLDYVDKYFQKNHKKGTHPYQTVALPVSKHFNYNEAITGDSLHKKLPKTYPSVDEADKAINEWKSANPVWVNQKTDELTPASIVAYGGTSLNRDIVMGKQQQMKDAGIDITVDGVWGPNSRAAWTEFSDPNKKEKVEGPVFTGSMTPTDQEGRPITAEGVGPQAGQTGRSKKDDVQVSAIERLPVEKIDIEKSETEVKQGIDPNSVEGKQILSNTDENKNTLGGTPILLEEGEPEDSTTSLINSIDDKKGKDIKIKENIKEDPEAKIVDTKTKLEESVDEDLEVKTEVDILKSKNKNKEVELTTGSIIADGENDPGDILKVEAAAKAEKERLRLEELANFTKSKGVVVGENKDKQGVIKKEELSSSNFFEEAGITSYTDADRQEKYLTDKLNMVDGTDVLKKKKEEQEVIDNTGGDQYVNDQAIVSDRMSTYEQNVLKDINEQSNSSYATKEDYLKDFPENKTNFQNAVNKYTGEFAQDGFVLQNNPISSDFINQQPQSFDKTLIKAQKQIILGNKVFEEMTSFDGDDVKGVLKTQFANIPYNDGLDFGKFTEQMKIEVLNLVNKKDWGKIAIGQTGAGYDKEQILATAKTRVIAKNNIVLNKVGQKLADESKINETKYLNFKNKRDDLRSDYTTVDNEIKDIKRKYGTYGFDTRGRQIFIPGIIDNKKAVVSKQDRAILDDINVSISQLDLRRDKLNVEGGEMKKIMESHQVRVEKWSKDNKDMWNALAWDMAKPIDKQRNAFDGTIVSKAWDIGYDQLTKNFFGAVSDIGGNFAEEYYRYKGLNKLFSGPQGWIAGLSAGTGYLASDLLDNTFPENERMGYSHKDQYLDFLGGAFTTKILPKNDIDKLFNSTNDKNKSFIDELLNPKAYNPSIYTITKTIGELLPYTLNIAKAGVGAKFAAGRKNIALKNKSTLFNQGMNRAGMGKLGDEIITSLHKAYIPSERMVQGVRMVATNHRMLMFDNMVDARNNGLSGNQALLYANLTTLATGVSQLVMPDVNFFKNTLAGKNMLKLFIKDLSKGGLKSATTELNKVVYSKAAKTFATNFFKEHAEEQLDVVLNDVVKSNFLADYSPEISNAAAQREIIVGTSLLTGTLGSVQARSTINNTKTLFYNQIYNENVELLNYSRSEINTIKQKIEQYSKYSKRYPSRKNLKKKLEAYEELLKVEQNNYDNVENVSQALNAAPRYATVGVIDNIMKKNELVKEKQKLIKGKDKAANKKAIDEVNEKIKKVDADIEAGSSQEWKKKVFRLSISRGVKLLKTVGLDLTVTEYSNDDYLLAVQNKNEEIKAENDERKKKGLKPKPFHTASGGALVIYNDGTNKPEIIINKDVTKQGGNFGVGVHEVFHLVMRETVRKSPKAVKAMSFLLRQELLSNPEKYGFLDMSKYVDRKFKTYQEQIGSMEWDEMFTVMSEAMAQGDVKINNGVLGKLHDIVRRTLRKVNVNIDFMPGTNKSREMLNFIRDYNKELLEGGQDFSPGMRRIIRKGLNIKFDSESKKALEAAEKEEDKAKLPEWMGDVIMRSSSSTRGGRTRSKNMYERKDIVDNLELSDNTKKIVEENERIRKELLESREYNEEEGKYEYDDDLRNDLVVNNMAVIFPLAKFASNNPNIMALESGKRITFDQWKAGYSEQLLKLSRTFDPSLGVPFGAYMNDLLPLRFGNVKDAAKKGEIENSVSINNEEGINDIADDSVPSDFDDAPRHSAKKHNLARTLGIEQEVEEEMIESLGELKEYKRLLKAQGKGEKEQLELAELKTKLKEKHMLDLDTDTLELSTVEDLLYKRTSALFGIDENKLNPRSTKFLANLRKDDKRGSNEVRSAQRFIANNGSLILAAIFNEGHTTAFKSTNMPNVLLRFGYNKSSKRIKNGFPMFKKPNLNESEFLEYLGIKRVTKNGVKGFEFVVDRNTSAKITAVASLFGRTMTNQSLRSGLEATGDLDERLRNSLEDGLSSSASSLFFDRNKDVDRKAVMKLMPQVGVFVQEIDRDGYDKKSLVNSVMKIFTENKTLTTKQARELAEDMFRESGVIMQYMYRQGNMQSKGINMMPFEDFAEKFLTTELYTGIIEKMNIVKENGDRPSQKEMFDLAAVKRARSIVADFVVEGIINTKLKSIESARKLKDKGKISEEDFNKQKAELLQQALDEIQMLELENATAYRIGDNSFYFEAGTNIHIRLFGQEGSSRFQLFHSPDGPQADFRKWLYKHMPQEFLDELTPEIVNIFKNGEKGSYSGLKFQPQDGEGVIKQMINSITNNTRKGANKYNQEEKNKEADLAERVTVNKIIYLAKKLSSGDILAEDFVIQMMTFGSNPQSSLRRAARVIGLMDGIVSKEGKFLLGEKISNELIRFEHTKPASYLLMKIIDIVTNPNIEQDKWAGLIKKEFIDYNVSIITKKADKTLDKSNLKNLMGKAYESGIEYGSMVRMFNEINLGDSDVLPIRLIEELLKGVIDGKVFGETHGVASDLLPKSMGEIKQDIKISDMTQSSNSINFDRSSRGMSAFDFDETVGVSDNFVIATKDNETKRIASDEWPMVGDKLVKEGWKMDFSDFNKVTNGKPGPLMEKMKNQIKKFGPKNVFILTARAPESQQAIHAYLESEGIKIPLKNITGLGNSTGEAKAVWMLNKFAEGYNDMYFVDDALPNVKAVKNVLEQLDIKSKVQLAISNQSVEFDKMFNDILEKKSGVDANKRFSNAKARRRGEENNKFRFFIPPSAEDFVGLLYDFLSSGKIGEEQMAFFKKALIQPLNRAYQALNNAKQAIANDFIALKKKMPEVAALMFKKIEGSEYTHSDAIRVYLWSKFGFKIPGLSETDQKNLVKVVKDNPKLQAFADMIGIMSRQKEGYIRPGDNWLVEDVRADLTNATSKINRKQFFAEFLENTSIIFSPENLNKIEAIYGKNFREALEDMLYRIENGTNRSFGQNRIVNRFMNWLNGSIGVTMFFNARSAILQTLSTVNFINWEDNNMIAAAKAFANQKQFWADFSMIFNSDMLRQRRSGLGMDINASEIADYVAQSGSMIDKYKAAVNFLLEKGFLPTQLADSFAISAGGATFYRNRLNKYVAEGMSVDDAASKAFNDFQEIAEATQQSARPDMVSQQQASVLGRIILAFQNTPMQYARLTKKAIRDLINGRGDPKAHVSRIIYYGAVQNAIFYTLQTALFAMMFEDDDDNEEFFDKKKERILSGSIDSILRGMGIAGAVVSTLKNMVIAFNKEQGKSYNKDESAVMMELLNLSPPLGIKVRQLRGAERTIQWNRDLMEEIPYYNIKNPAWEATFQFTQMATNIPLARLHKKATNISAAFDEDAAAWQRIALMMGWTTWNLGIKDTKRKGKKRRKKVGKPKVGSGTQS